MFDDNLIMSSLSTNPFDPLVITGNTNGVVIDDNLFIAMNQKIESIDSTLTVTGNGYGVMFDDNLIISSTLTNPFDPLVITGNTNGVVIDDNLFIAQDYKIESIDSTLTVTGNGYGVMFDDNLIMSSTLTNPDDPLVITGNSNGVVIDDNLFIATDKRIESIDSTLTVTGNGYGVMFDDNLIMSSTLTNPLDPLIITGNENGVQIYDNLFMAPDYKIESMEGSSLILTGNGLGVMFDDNLIMSSTTTNTPLVITGNSHGVQINDNLIIQDLNKIESTTGYSLTLSANGYGVTIYDNLIKSNPLYSSGGSLILTGNGYGITIGDNLIQSNPLIHTSLIIFGNDYGVQINDNLLMKENKKIEAIAGSLILTGQNGQGVMIDDNLIQSSTISNPSSSLSITGNGNGVLIDDNLWISNGKKIKAKQGQLILTTADLSGVLFQDSLIMSSPFPIKSLLSNLVLIADTNYDVSINSTHAINIYAPNSFINGGNLTINDSLNNLQILLDTSGNITAQGSIFCGNIGSKNSNLLLQAYSPYAIDLSASQINLKGKTSAFLGLDISNNQTLTVGTGGRIRCDTFYPFTTNGKISFSAPLVSSGDISGTSFTTNGQVKCASVYSTGDISGTSLTTSGQVKCASVSSSGDISGTSFTTSGQVKCASVSASGDISGASLSTHGSVTCTSITASQQVTSPYLYSGDNQNLILQAGKYNGSPSSSVPMSITIQAYNVALRADNSLNCSKLQVEDVSGNTKITLDPSGGAVSCVSLTSSGNVSGSSLSTTGGGAVTCGSVVSTGDVSGSSISTNGLVTCTQLTSPYLYSGNNQNLVLQAGAYGGTQTSSANESIWLHSYNMNFNASNALYCGPIMYIQDSSNVNHIRLEGSNGGRISCDNFYGYSGSYMNIYATTTFWNHGIFITDASGISQITLDTYGNVYCNNLRSQNTTSNIFNVLSSFNIKNAANTTTVMSLKTDGTLTTIGGAITVKDSNNVSQIVLDTCGNVTCNTLTVNNGFGFSGNLNCAASIYCDNFYPYTTNGTININAKSKFTGILYANCIDGNTTSTDASNNILMATQNNTFINFYGKNPYTFIESTCKYNGSIAYGTVFKSGYNSSPPALYHSITPAPDYFQMSFSTNGTPIMTCSNTSQKISNIFFNGPVMITDASANTKITLDPSANKLTCSGNIACDTFYPFTNSGTISFNGPLSCNALNCASVLSSGDLMTNGGVSVGTKGVTSPGLFGGLTSDLTIQAGLYNGSPTASQNASIKLQAWNIKLAAANYLTCSKLQVQDNSNNTFITLDPSGGIVTCGSLKSTGDVSGSSITTTGLVNCNTMSCTTKVTSPNLYSGDSQNLTIQAGKYNGSPSSAVPASIFIQAQNIALRAVGTLSCSKLEVQDNSNNTFITLDPTGGAVSCGSISSIGDISSNGTVYCGTFRSTGNLNLRPSGYIDCHTADVSNCGTIRCTYLISSSLIVSSNLYNCYVTSGAAWPTCDGNGYITIWFNPKLPVSQGSIACQASVSDNSSTYQLIAQVNTLTYYYATVRIVTMTNSPQRNLAVRINWIATWSPSTQGTATTGTDTSNPPYGT
jgi:hypothetical protein